MLLKSDLSIDLTQYSSFEKLEEKLGAYINHLIIEDFDGLINLLYKVDVNESRLKQLLKESHDTDAAKIIAELIIERQLQKIKSRNESKTANSKDYGSDEERW